MFISEPDPQQERNYRQASQNKQHIIEAMLLLASLGGCEVEAPNSSSDEAQLDDSKIVTQGWYGTAPYDQHCWMTYKASKAASGHGISWQCEEEWSAGGRVGSIFGEGEWDYTGKLCNTNILTNTTRNHTDFFRSPL
jgi:hypothetical protein